MGEWEAAGPSGAVQDADASPTLPEAEGDGGNRVGSGLGNEFREDPEAHHAPTSRGHSERVDSGQP